jgi:hypothetical protein
MKTFYVCAHRLFILLFPLFVCVGLAFVSFFTFASLFVHVSVDGCRESSG